MNFYKRHIGDYIKDTAHLSLLQHGIYARLLDVYYTRESALPDADIARLIGARSKEERRALLDVLSEFFTKEGTDWVHGRCELEISLANAKADKNRDVGKLGGRPKKKETTMVSENNHDGFISEPKHNPSQTPDSRLQNSDPDGSGGRPPAAMTKDEVWHAGKSLLQQAGMPSAQCGSYVGKLVKDYGGEIVLEAVRSATVERPADPASYIKAVCQRSVGEKGRPNKQEALEKRNRTIAEQLAQEAT